jgi:hypothetical protein
MKMQDGMVIPMVYFEISHPDIQQKESMLVFWVVMLFGLQVDTNVLEKHLHLQGRMLVSTYKSTRHYNPEEQH